MKPRSRLRRRLIIAAAFVLLFTVAGFFLLPPILKSQLQKRLSAKLGRAVTVETVKVNPYALSLTFENFAIRESNTAADFVRWRRLYVNFDALGSLRGEWVLSEIALDGFDSRVAINADHSFNFSDVLAKFATTEPAPPAPSKPGRPIRIRSVKVADARVDFSDASRKQPFATVLGPVTFALTEFRTVSAVGAPYRFEAVTEAGEKFVWSGTLQAEPLHSVGELSLENIALAKYAPYYADQIQADIVSGTLSVRGHYDLNLTNGQQVMKLAEGAAQLRGLKLQERGMQQTAIELPSLDVTGVQADGLNRKVSIDAIVLSGGRVQARREKDGAINLLTMLRPPGDGGHVSTVPAASPVPAAQTASPPRAPEISIGQVALKDWTVNISDLAAPRPVQLALGGIELSLDKVTLAEGAQMPLHLAFTLGAHGTVRVDGNVGIAPLNAEIKTDVANLELLPLSPYLEQFTNTHVTQGTVTATLDTQFLMADGERPVASTVGEVKVEKLGLVDAAKNEELAGFGLLSLKGLRAATAPSLSVTLEEITLASPYARIVVNQDRTLNLATLLQKESAATGSERGAVAVAASSTTVNPSIAVPSTANKAATGASAPKIEIGKVIITDGDYRFTDRSVEPNVGIALNQFGGTISGLSSVKPAKADVDLKAMVDGAGPVSIRGKLDALGPQKTVDLKVDFKNVDLQPLSPYSGKFAGYELARGKLLLDVKLNVDGNKIDAANVITLNQFTFGNAVKSPDATSLPVRLGVALLKDMDGKIVIDVPVQGSTDDPNFRIGRVVLRVIVNLLTKAAVSPFSLLGAAFGGGGDELAYQDFAPGSSDLQPAEIKKLETMVKALTNRPGLSVDLDGHYDAAADAYALQRVKLADMVRRAVWESKRAADPNIAPPAELVVTPEEHAAMIKKLYDEKFPPGTQFGAPIPPPPVLAAPPPPPAGFFKRMVNALTLQGRREERAVEEANARAAAEHARAVAAALATGLPVEEMTGRLAETVTVDDNDLRALAQARAQRVRDYFTQVGQIAPERLFLAKEKPDAAKERKGARVFLGLQ